MNKNKSQNATFTRGDGMGIVKKNFELYASDADSLLQGELGGVYDTLHGPECIIGKTFKTAHLGERKKTKEQRKEKGKRDKKTKKNEEKRKRKRKRERTGKEQENDSELGNSAAWQTRKTLAGHLDAVFFGVPGLGFGLLYRREMPREEMRLER